LLGISGLDIQEHIIVITSNAINTELNFMF
jgi:hypothetical protein